MKVIIAGSRSITDYQTVKKILDKIDIEMGEIVSGCAQGVDTLGEWYADQYGIPVKRFHADWENLKAPGAVIKEKRGRRYNASAGFQRNEAMARYADALVLIWDGKSKGSADMLRRAVDHKLTIHEVIL